MGERRLGRGLLLAALAFTACLALAGLALHGALSPAEMIGFPVRGRSMASKSQLIHKLNQLLMRKLSKAQDGISSAAPESVRRAAPAVASVTKTQLEANACHDGGPCNNNQMPVLRYVPRTGNWELKSAGNQEAIWQNIFNRFKSRDKKTEAPLRTVPESFNAFKAPEQMLAQVDDASGERAALQAKLKNLLESQLRASGDLGGMSGFGEGSEPAGAGRGDSGGAVAGLEGNNQDIHALAEDMQAAKHLAAHGTGHDLKRMKTVSTRLQDDSKLRTVCQDSSQAQHSLGVLRWSSLSSCMRQLRTRKANDVKLLLARIHALSASRGAAPVLAVGHSLHAAEARVDALEARKAALTQGLSKMVADGTHLQSELRAQQERVQQLRMRPARGGGRGRDYASPPVPPGLPPGYDGPMLERGSTDVPRSAPPGM